MKTDELFAGGAAGPVIWYLPRRRGAREEREEARKSFTRDGLEASSPGSLAAV